MSKRRKVEVVNTSNYPEIAAVPVNWDLCIICQQQSTEPLQTPKQSGYKTLINILKEFKEKDALPHSIRFENFDDGSGMLSTLTTRNAKYHKKCRNRYDSQKLSRLSTPSTSLSESVESSSQSYVPNTRSSSTTFDIKVACLFCGGQAMPKNKLLCACTKEIGPRIYEQAVEMQDTNLLSKISSTDFIALEVKYHNDCYTQFRNAYRSHQRAMLNDGTDPHSLTYGSVISELVQYMEDSFLYSNTVPVFKLSDLVALVSRRMSSLGVPSTDRSLNRTRLKDLLLRLVPGLREDKSGRDILLTFDANVGDAVRKACRFNDLDDDSFEARKCVPPALVTFLTILLGGSNIDSGSPASGSEQAAAYSIAELIRFNSVKRKRQNRPEHVRHQIEQETPLPVYLGMMIHSQTRKRSLVEKVNRLGLCVSYSRILEIESSITNTVCEIYNSVGSVVPVTLQKDVFITAAIDNIDHNPSSSTSNESFHGSSATVIQHPDSSEITFPTLCLTDVSWTRQVHAALPESFTQLPVSGPVTGDIPLSSINKWSPDTTTSLSAWLYALQKAVDNSCMEEHVSFASYHSTSVPNVDSHVTVKCHNVLLPLLVDHIQSPATIKHLMNVIINITQSTSPGQPAVITADQPVFAIAKYIQWKCSNLYGEDKVVMMMGGLHIEMAILNMISKWLASSGWTDIFLKADIATSGRSQSLLKSSHVKRARYAHEVSLAALYILRNDAYIRDCADTNETIPDWTSRWCKESAQFLYWNTTIELESLLFRFIKSIRESNFRDFVRTLTDVCPWFFSLDLVHYSRWVPVFLQTLQELPDRHPQVHAEFMKGHFTSRKSNSPFSAISDDHLHEQNNKIIKGDGGAVGLFDNEKALLKWMVGGPELSRMVREFEQTAGDLNSDRIELQHHENTSTFQSRFIRHVSAVVNMLREDGNPFLEQLLQTVDSLKICISGSGEKSVFEAAEKGRQEFNDFVLDRLTYCRKSLRDLMPKMNLELFVVPKTSPNINKLCLSDLKNDSNLFCKLYVASQTRESDVDDFFAHENNKFPPSLSEGGKLRKATNKSDILKCFDQYMEDSPIISAEVEECAIIIDGAAAVHMVSPGASKNFGEYCSVFGSYVDQLLKSVQRLDIVFDQYLPNSLKVHTRESRGSGQRINVTPTTTIPQNFSKFLTVDGNKQQLFNLLARCVVSRSTNNKLVVCTVDDSVVSNHSLPDVSLISPCTAEEADGRLLLHAKHAINSRIKCITVSTVDSDVVVISVHVFSYLIGIEKLWMDFRVGRSRRLISIHDLHRNMPQTVISNLPIFHSFTGCDTVSSFCNIGKRTAWKTWLSYPEVNDAFHTLSTSDSVDEETLKTIERFVVLLYDRSSDCCEVNSCRRRLYTRKNRAIENIPPTSNALLHHCQRSALQAKVWQSCLSSTAPRLDPKDWGWIEAEHGTYSPLWCSIPDVSLHCSELIHCACKTSCKKNCKCQKNGLRCTRLCACDGLCDSTAISSTESAIGDVTGGDQYEMCVVEENSQVDNIIFN